MLFFSAWWVANSSAGKDVFKSVGGGLNRDLDRIPAVDMRALKLAHAQSETPFDIGVFGNSRMISISAADLNIGKKRYFNFSVPGTSIRNSVAMLERLAKNGRAPGIAIIGFDNVSLEFFENSEAYLFPERLNLVWNDLTYLISGDVPLRDGVKVLWRHALKAWSTLETWLKFSAFSERRERSAGNKLPNYRSDGSRHQVIKGGTPFSLDMTVPLRAILPSILAQDLRRLVRVSEVYGVRVIVIETPLHPHIRMAGGRARNLRADFQQLCLEMGLECHSVSGLSSPLAAADWPDATHAPVAAFGHVIAGFLDGGSAAQ